MQLRYKQKNSHSTFHQSYNPLRHLSHNAFHQSSHNAFHLLSHDSFQQSSHHLYVYHGLHHYGGFDAPNSLSIQLAFLVLPFASARCFMTVLVPESKQWKNMNETSCVFMCSCVGPHSIVLLSSLLFYSHLQNIISSSRWCFQNIICWQCLT